MAPIQQAELFFKAGDFRSAFDELSKIKKGSLERDLLLAKCGLKLGNVPGAIIAFSQVLARDPKHIYAASNLATLYFNERQLGKAVDVYKKTLRHVEDDKLRCELGVMLWSLGDRANGYAEVDKVVSRRPGFHAARFQRAIMLMLLGEKERSADDYRILVTQEPENPDYLGALGEIEFGLGRSDEAVLHLKKAVALRPDNGTALKSLAFVQIVTGDIEGSHQSFRQLKVVDPKAWAEVAGATSLGKKLVETEDFDPRPVFLSIAFQEQEVCNWARRGQFEKVFRDFIAEPGGMDISSIMHNAGIIDFDNDERLMAMKVAAASVERGIQPFSQRAVERREKLKVGYVFPHLGAHVVAIIIRAMIAAHDREKFEIFVYSTRQSRHDYESGMAERYKMIPELCYEDLTPLTDAEAARRIYESKLDVLVDLAVYNDHARPGIMAHRPAPIQVSYLGAPFTSGSGWMDYIVTDDVVSPKEAWCTEAEVRMPRCYFVYGHEDEAPPPRPLRSAFGLQEEVFLFSALNNPYKLDPEAFSSWMRILAATPGSKILLKDAGGVPDSLRREAVRHGVDADRLIFAPRLASDRDYLLRQGTPDVFLDTRVYGAHTTMAESLWMGVPGISCPGKSFQSRVGASLLASCDMNELIVPDWQAYESLAISLFHDRARLDSLRSRLATTRLHAAPFDIQGQTRALEKAYLHMLARRAEGLPCAAFDIAAL
ncbi:MAG: tetratricopeptide repeat protein [Pedobacter sp.]|nr:tetratricopeptide repeat protein [Pedobacter sp.]